MTLERDLARIRHQEQTLAFPSFTPLTAWELGTRMRQLAVDRSAPMALEIQLGEHLLFHCALPGTTPGNADWIRRKRNTVLRFHRSSYAMGLSLEAEKSTLQEKLAFLCAITPRTAAAFLSYCWAQVASAPLLPPAFPSAKTTTWSSRHWPLN